MKYLLMNGSPRGERGNTALLLNELKQVMKGLRPQAEVDSLVLLDTPTEMVLERILWAQALVFSTGTYWDSWGSPLQRFLEESTHAEGSATWLGKPAAVLITAHSVGAKGVLSRLQGVLNTLGCALPPMSGWVYTLAAQQALHAASPATQLPSRDDFWCLNDLATVAHNLITAAEGRSNFRSWPVDRADPGALWVGLEG